MAKKIILTVESKLRLKYGVNFPVLENLLYQLVISDAAKGLSTAVIYIDSAAAADQFNYPQPVNLTEKTYKDIVDHIYAREEPEYLVLFGAQDVFPFQQLVNQLNPKDPDKFIDSDLPYACNSAYSTDCNAFTNPTRVVGRIPDEPLADGKSGNGNVDFVDAVIKHIIYAVPSAAENCSQYLANSAFVWSGSTQTSVRNIFGNAFSLKISPANNTSMYLPTEVASLPHFFNLHGALNDSRFFGQQGLSYPSALEPSDLTGLVKKGCFVAAECCYGAWLFDRSYGTSIPGAYMEHGASVYMGSSTIAYGPRTGQGLADLITQYFMINILKGESSGRALLSARQKFLSVSGPSLDFHELKTIAQFHILGDPSLQPVAVIDSPDMMNTIEDRRFNLTAKGVQLGVVISDTQKIDEQETKGPAADFDLLLPMKKKLSGLYDSKLIFETEQPLVQGMKGMNMFNPAEINTVKTRYHVYQSGKVAENGIVLLSAFVVKERDNRMMGYRQYFSR